MEQVTHKLSVLIFSDNNHMLQTFT